MVGGERTHRPGPRDAGPASAGTETRDAATGEARETGLRDFATAVALDLRRRARSDALPEHTQYTDTGCDVHPRCLTCPLVRCRYDAPGGARKLFSEDRDRSIVSMYRDGVPVDAIALRFGVSRRTVFRALARARRGPPAGAQQTSG